MPDTGSSYDAVADEYVRRFLSELDRKPFDRKLLDDFADRIEGPVADIGCGPGHVARYLSERRVRVSGVDLSQQMIEQARELHPGISFRQGDMGALDFETGSLEAIVAFYWNVPKPRIAIHPDRFFATPGVIPSATMGCFQAKR